MNPQIYIGTSGWNYNHWKELFYPTDCPKTKWLEFYATHFRTVELNASFYRLPHPQTFENWRKRTPDNFLWSVKASRYITHIKRIKDVKEPLERFFSSAELLKEKLGPILFQLPPNLAFDEVVLNHFCQKLTANHLYALEVRHPSWAPYSGITTSLCVFLIQPGATPLSRRTQPLSSTSGFMAQKNSIRANILRRNCKHMPEKSGIGLRKPTFILIMIMAAMPLRMPRG